MTISQGACSCGTVEIAFTHARPHAEYSPRACDCDYCEPRGAQWLSDPQGQLEVLSAAAMREETQGSGQARFHVCPHCGDLVAVSYDTGEGLLGAVNARVLKAYEELSEAQSASPKRLDAQQKTERWSALWTPTRIRYRSTA
ncbi:MAG: aldehyde-activating protein [Pseudomonadota bacterium]